MIIYMCNILRGLDYRWLENTEHCITDAAQDANISWSAYHVEQQQAREYYQYITYIFDVANVSWWLQVHGHDTSCLECYPCCCKGT